MDFIFRLFGSKFDGFRPIEDYDSGEARYDKYSLMKAIEGYTIYDKWVSSSYLRDDDQIRDYRATQHSPSPINRVENIIAHATKNAKNWNVAVDGTTPLIEAVRVGESDPQQLKRVKFKFRQYSRRPRHLSRMAWRRQSEVVALAHWTGPLGNYSGAGRVVSPFARV